MFWSSGVLTGNPTRRPRRHASRPFWRSGVLTGNPTTLTPANWLSPFWSSGVLTGNQTICSLSRQRDVKTLPHTCMCPLCFSAMVCTSAHYRRLDGGFSLNASQKTEANSVTPRVAAESTPCDNGIDSSGQKRCRRRRTSVKVA